VTAYRIDDLPRRADRITFGRELLGSLGLYFEPPLEEQTNRRGEITRAARAPYVALTGPIGGTLAADPKRLRHEARRLLDAADTLEAHARPELYPEFWNPESRIPIPDPLRLDRGRETGTAKGTVIGCVYGGDQDLDP